MDFFNKKDDGNYEVILEEESIINLRSYLMIRYGKSKIHYYVKHNVSLYKDNPMYNNYSFEYNVPINDRDIIRDYLGSYTEETYPSIVKLINKILNKDVSAVRKLYDINRRNWGGKMKPYYKELEKYVRLVKKDKNSSIENNVPSNNRFKSLTRKLIRKN